MKRSQMERALLRKLKKWENCKIRMKEAKEILEFIESKGMQPPIIRILENSYNRSEGEMGYEVNEWEEEVDKN